LVHGDLDAAGSRDAPLDGNRLAAKPVAGWLLGHIHAPRLLNEPGRPWVLYPGSPQGLDPGEEGVHGVWIADVLPTTIACPVEVPISTVRHERIVINVGGVENENGLRIRLREELRDRRPRDPALRVSAREAPSVARRRGFVAVDDTLRIEPAGRRRGEPPRDSRVVIAAGPRGDRLGTRQ